MNKVSKKSIIRGTVAALCIIGLLFFVSSGKKPYQYLRTDNLDYIELSDTSGETALRIEAQEDMTTIVGAMKKIRTYNNMLSRDVSSDQFVFNLVYSDGRSRPVILAIAAGEKADGKTHVPCVTLDKRWYKIDDSTAETLVKVYEQFRHFEI